jgi:hypothetical protein
LKIIPSFAEIEVRKEECLLKIPFRIVNLFGHSVYMSENLPDKFFDISVNFQGTSDQTNVYNEIMYSFSSTPTAGGSGCHQTADSLQ